MINRCKQDLQNPTIFKLQFPKLFFLPIIKNMNFSPNEITFTSPQLQAINTKIIVKNINNITGDQNQINKIYQSIVNQLESKLLA